MIYFLNLCLLFILSQTTQAATANCRPAVGNTAVGSDATEELARHFTNTYGSFLNWFVKPMIRVDPKRKEQLRIELVEMYRNYQKALEAQLESIGVIGEWREYESFHLKELIGREETFFITPGNQSPLNRLAKRIKEKYGVDLVYDPISLSKWIGGQAAYHPLRNILYLDFHAGLQRVSDDFHSVTKAHELIHVIFDAFRSGLSLKAGKLPVHFRIVNNGEIFHLEEVVAHGLNIRLMAGALKRESNPETKKELLQELLASQKLILQYSRTTFNLINQSIAESSIEKSRFKKKVIDKQTWVEVAIGDAYIRVFVAKNEAKYFRLNPKKFLKRKLLTALTLAQFNLDYLSSLKPQQEEFLESALNFRSTQIQLMENWLAEEAAFYSKNE